MKILSLSFISTAFILLGRQNRIKTSFFGDDVWPNYNFIELCGHSTILHISNPLPNLTRLIFDGFNVLESLCCLPMRQSCQSSVCWPLSRVSRHLIRNFSGAFLVVWTLMELLVYLCNKGTRWELRSSWKILQNQLWKYNSDGTSWCLQREGNAHTI